MRILILTLLFLVHAGAAVAGEEPLSAVDDLRGVEWRWHGSRYNDDTEAVPSTPGHFTLSFGEDGVFRVRADCNRASGGYVVDGNRITLTLGPMTRAMCPPESLDRTYLKDLSAVQSWVFHAGDLILMLKSDAGTMRFRSGEG